MVTSSSVLRYCLFYNGACLPPLEIVNTIPGMLWQAEKVLCDDMYNIIDGKNPQLSLAQYVYAYLQKWFPWEADKAMGKYLEKCPQNVRDAFKKL